MFKKYLFNFSSSYSGGGLKRLIAFCNWFDQRGGACFIVNEKLRGEVESYTNNRFFFVGISKLSMALNHQSYLDPIIKEIGFCEFYYSYNIPMKKIDAGVTWFHLSNVLPLLPAGKYGVPTKRSLELFWLGVLIKLCFKHADFISAESNFALSLLPRNLSAKRCLSINGSDDELGASFSVNKLIKRREIAVVVGTHFHKNLRDSYEVFRTLKTTNKSLQLEIFGDKNSVGSVIRNDPCVTLLGEAPRIDILKALRSAKYYINTTLVENSWNSALEGLLLAEQSAISLIPPHIELLRGDQQISHLNVKSRIPVGILGIENIDLDKLKTWHEVILETIGSRHMTKDE